MQAFSAKSTSSCSSATTLQVSGLHSQPQERGRLLRISPLHSHLPWSARLRYWLASFPFTLRRKVPGTSLSVLCWAAKTALLALQGAVQAPIMATTMTTTLIAREGCGEQGAKPSAGPTCLWLAGAQRRGQAQAAQGHRSSLRGAADGGLSARCFLGHPTERSGLRGSSSNILQAWDCRNELLADCSCPKGLCKELGGWLTAWERSHSKSRGK